jgi:hypothetical protein
MARTNLKNSVSPDMVAKGTRAQIVARSTFRFLAPNGDTVWRLHQTDIVRRKPDGRFVLDSGGYKTVTTKDRMNRFSPFRISQAKGVWTVHHEGRSVPYYDGMVLPDALDAPVKADKLGRREAKLRASIKRFVCDTLPDTLTSVPHPGPGDCLICHFERSKIQEAITAANGAGAVWQIGANDISGDASHIESHIKEKYMHGALIANACMWRNGATWQNVIHYWGVKRLRGVVRDYLYARMGLVR